MSNVARRTFHDYYWFNLDVCTLLSFRSAVQCVWCVRRATASNSQTWHVFHMDCHTTPLMNIACIKQQKKMVIIVWWLNDRQNNVMWNNQHVVDDVSFISAIFTVTMLKKVRKKKNKRPTTEVNGWSTTKILIWFEMEICHYLLDSYAFWLFYYLLIAVLSWCDICCEIIWNGFEIAMVCYWFYWIAFDRNIFSICHSRSRRHCLPHPFSSKFVMQYALREQTKRAEKPWSILIRIAHWQQWLRKVTMSAGYCNE